MTVDHGVDPENGINLHSNTSGVSDLSLDFNNTNNFENTLNQALPLW